jgi:hypothetical protein
MKISAKLNFDAKHDGEITYCSNGDSLPLAMRYSIAQRPSLPKLAPSAKRA